MESWYDYRLVFLSVIVAMLASHLALSIASRIREHDPAEQLWLAGGAVAMGLGIWAMHFIGMLAYHLPIPLGYDVSLTLLSLLMAIVASAFALYIIFSNERLDPLTNAVSALLMGAGIAGMHYVGIYAMRISPPIRFDSTLFIASLLIAFAASFFALRFAFASKRSETLFDLNKSVASIIMGLAIAGMHYTAMAAQRIDGDAICMAAGSGLEPGVLALIVALAVLGVLLTTATVLNYDMKLMAGEKSHAMQLAKQRAESLAEARQIAEDLARDYRRSEEFANELFDTIGVVVAVVNRTGTVVRFNKGAEQVTGFSREEVIGKPLWERLVPHGQIDQVRLEFSTLTPARFPNSHVSYWKTQGGEARLIAWSNTALLDEYGDVEYVIATGSDITEQQKAEEELRLAAVAFNTNEAIVITDASGFILRCNKVFSEITGYSADEAVGKKTTLLKSGKHDDAFYRDMWGNINRHGFWMGEIWNRRKSGEVYPELLRITAVRDGKGSVSNYVASFSDISILKETEKQLSYLSNYDQPTGLPNKRLFLELLAKQMLMVNHDRERGLLFYLRLEQLRRLNESLGMRVVDEYLTRFKENLLALVGNQAIIGRLSGGDFAIAVGGIKSDEQLSFLASNIAEAVIAYVKAGEHIGDDDVHPGVYMGIASYGQHGFHATDILQHAITALNRAEHVGNSGYQFYSESLHRQAAESYSMEVALRRAAQLGELSLHFQPQRDSSGALVGGEALLRWAHGEVTIPPTVFIPLAERAGLIGELGDFVFEEGIRWIARFIEQGLPPGFGAVALNMSALQFSDIGVLERLKRCLVEFNVPPERLKIEITESVLFDDPERVIRVITEMKSLGIGIALDDFGTGYSSLSYLHKLPLDQIKIDQSFVRDISINPVSRAITETIIAMAQNMGLEVIAEGVENRSEADILQEFGCHHFQGYYFGQPIPGEEFNNLL